MEKEPFFYYQAEVNGVLQEPCIIARRPSRALLILERDHPYTYAGLTLQPWRLKNTGRVPEDSPEHPRNKLRSIEHSRLNDPKNLVA